MKQTDNKTSGGMHQQNLSKTLCLLLIINFLFSVGWSPVSGQGSSSITVGDSFSVNKAKNTLDLYTTGSNLDQQILQKVNNSETSHLTFNVTKIDPVAQTTTQMYVNNLNILQTPSSYSVTNFAKYFGSNFLSSSQAVINNTKTIYSVDSPFVRKTGLPPIFWYLTPNWEELATRLGKIINTSLNIDSSYVSGTNSTKFTLGDMLKSTSSFNLFGATRTQDLPQAIRNLKNYFFYQINYTSSSPGLSAQSHFVELKIKYSSQGILEYIIFKSGTRQSTGTQDYLHETVTKITITRESTKNSGLQIFPFLNNYLAPFLFFGIFLADSLLIIGIYLNLRKRKIVLNNMADDGGLQP